MPQVDLDTLVSICSGGGDCKIACEPLPAHAAGEQPLDDSDDDEEKKPDLPQPTDSPPESFWLSRDAEFDWFDRNAFYERKDSGKGSNSANLNPNLNPHPNNSSSQRFSKNLKAKAKIIGLPKTQKASYVDANRRNCKKKPANARFFNSNNKALVEPSSPKVSCMGRVRSKRGRKKVRSDDKKAVEKSSRGVERSRTGLYGRFMAIFRSKRRTGPPPPVEESAPRRSVEVRSSFRGEPPGLGGMTRFASGRRSASSWAGDE